jgi:hypothetical protein
MNNKLKHLSRFNHNVSAMAGCKYGDRKDIGLIAPKHLTSGYGELFT